MMPTWSQRSDHAFPYLVERVGDLPASLAPAASAALPPGSRLDLIFVAPADAFPGRSGAHRVPEQALVFTENGVLHVRAAAGSKSPPQATYIAADELLYLQSGLLLLYGRIEMAGRVGGALAQAVVEYNTVGWDLVQPSVQRLVQKAASESVIAAPSPEPAGVETLIDGLPYKFANGVRIYAVQKDETLLGVALQPDLWVPHLGIFRRQLTPQTALALTDRSVVLIEEERGATRKNARYGWVFSYIPLSAIIGMQVSQLGTRHELTIRMQRGDASAERRLILDNGPASAWRNLWATYAQPRREQIERDEA